MIHFHSQVGDDVTVVVLLIVKMPHIGLKYKRPTSYKTWSIFSLELAFGVDIDIFYF